MGLVKTISIIGLIAALSIYDTGAAFVDFSGPDTTDTVVAATITAGPTAGQTTTTAAVMIVEDTATGTTIATVQGAGDGTVTYAATTTTTIFATVIGTGVISVTGTASVSGSPYTYVVEATDDADDSVGTITITITVNALPTFSSGTRCWLIADAAAVATSLATYSASAVESSQAITAYTILGTSDSNTDFTSPMVSGLLATAEIMDAATTEIYSLVLQAADDGAMPATGTLVVFVSVEGTTTQSCGTAGLLGSLLVVMAVLVAQFM